MVGPRPSRWRYAPPQDEASRWRYAPPQDEASRWRYAPPQDEASRRRYAPPQDEASRRRYAPPQDEASRRRYAPPQDEGLVLVVIPGLRPVMTDVGDGVCGFTPTQPSPLTLRVGAMEKEGEGFREVGVGLGFVLAVFDEAVNDAGVGQGGGVAEV